MCQVYSNPATGMAESGAGVQPIGLCACCQTRILQREANCTWGPPFALVLKTPLPTKQEDCSCPSMQLSRATAAAVNAVVGNMYGEGHGSPQLTKRTVSSAHISLSTHGLSLRGSRCSNPQTPSWDFSTAAAGINAAHQLPPAECLSFTSAASTGGRTELLFWPCQVVMLRLTRAL